MAAHFAKRNTKFGGGKRGRGGRGFQGGNSAAPERSAAAKFRASETGAPHRSILIVRDY